MDKHTKIVIDMMDMMQNANLTVVECFACISTLTTLAVECSKQVDIPGHELSEMLNALIVKIHVELDRLKKGGN